jgi:hypothetical protein
MRNVECEMKGERQRHRAFSGEPKATACLIERPTAPVAFACLLNARG